MQIDGFGNEEIIVLHKSIIEAYYDMSSLEKNIIYTVLNKIDGVNPFLEYYTFQLAELAKATKKEIRSDELKEATHKLISRVLEMEDEKGHIFKTPIVSSTEYIKGGTVKVFLEDRIKYYLSHMDNFHTPFEYYTVIKYKEAISLKSKYSKRIYEMLCQYKHTKIFIISVEELKYRLAIKDPETGIDKYSKWNNFKTHILDTAEEQINESTDIKFSYIAKRTGRKFTDLEFKINYKAKLIG